MSNLPYGQLYMPRDLLRKQWHSCSRLRRYSVNGISLTAIGLAMLYVYVDHLNVPRFLAHALIVPATMFVVSYIVHKRRSFGDRLALGHKPKMRYAAVRFGGMGVSKVSFLILVFIAGLPYLLVSIFITAVLAWPTYRLNRDWVFAEEEVEASLAEP